MKKRFLLLTAVALTSMVGCAGYQPGVNKPKKMAAVTKLAVPTFKNNTLQPRLEVLVTDALIKRLQIAGTYKIVPVNEADAVLYGTIEDITSRSIVPSVIIPLRRVSFWWDSRSNTRSRV